MRQKSLTIATKREKYYFIIKILIFKTFRVVDEVVKNIDFSIGISD